MNKQLLCDCDKRVGTNISSLKLFEELKEFFESQTDINIFEELKSNISYYSWKNGNKKVEWYATKWYKCSCCNCLWEFNYPDFPAEGFVRKFPDGAYKPIEIIVDGKIIEIADDDSSSK